MKKNLLFFVIGLFCLNSIILQAQEDLLSLVTDSTESPKKEFASATFKGTRLINFHTVELPGPNSLEFRISHHFGDFNSGGYNFWGLDGGASIRLGLEYSKDGRFEVGIGRSSLDKVYDGFLKYKLIRQTLNNKQPFTMTLFSSLFYATIKDPNRTATGVDRYEFSSSRLSYCHQILIARKFSDRLSVQFAPTLVHYNLVDFVNQSNDQFIASFGARYKFTKRFALTFEYGYRVNDRTIGKYFDSMGIGFDLETGGHVFQMFLTNSAGMIESQYFGRTTSSWSNWGIKLGFNVSRMFSIGGKAND
jgi:hypothetical protein